MLTYGLFYSHCDLLMDPWNIYLYVYMWCVCVHTCTYIHVYVRTYVCMNAFYNRRLGLDVSAAGM
jgi:hypothetical protein